MEGMGNWGLVMQAWISHCAGSASDRHHWQLIDETKFKLVVLASLTTLQASIVKQGALEVLSVFLGQKIKLNARKCCSWNYTTQPLLPVLWSDLCCKGFVGQTSKIISLGTSQAFMCKQDAHGLPEGSSGLNHERRARQWKFVHCFYLMSTSYDLGSPNWEGIVGAGYQAH